MSPPAAQALLGWAELAAAWTRWYSYRRPQRRRQRQGDIATRCLHGASSSICHRPCTTRHFKFPSSKSVEKLQPCQVFGEKEG